MPKRVSIAAARRVCEEQGCKQVIVVLWDGERTHVVTYGVDRLHCAQAADGGKKIAEALGLELRS